MLDRYVVVSAATVVSAAKNVTPRERIAVTVAPSSRAIRPFTCYLPFEAYMPLGHFSRVPFATNPILREKVSTLFGLAPCPFFARYCAKQFKDSHHSNE